MNAAQHDAQHRAEHAGGEERAEHRAAHPRRKQAGEQRHADGAVGGFAQADDAARAHQLRVASGERAAPIVARLQTSAMRKMLFTRLHRSASSDSGTAPSATVIETIETSAPSWPIRQVPLRLEVREHRDHDLAVDVVDDHQREHDREDRPGVAARRRPALPGVVFGVVERCSSCPIPSLGPGASRYGSWLTRSDDGLSSFGPVAY